MNQAIACSIALLGMAMGPVLAQAEPPSQKAAAKQVSLICQAQNRVRYLSVDYAQKTVNGFKATVGDALVTWNSEEFDPARKRKVLLRHELNRIEGGYRAWPDGEGSAETATVFGCDKAPAARF